MIKTEEDFRNYMKGKTIHYNLLLALKDLSDKMAEAEREIFESNPFMDCSEEEFEVTHNLLLALITKNSFILMKTFIKFLDIPEDEIDMEINPVITYDKEKGETSVTRGRPDWFNILNHWSVCFDLPNTELKTITEKESLQIVEESKELSKQYISTDAAKMLNKAELERKIFNIMV